jgi:hypothetical protein
LETKDKKDEKIKVKTKNNALNAFRNGGTACPWFSLSSSIFSALKQGFSVFGQNSLAVVYNMVKTLSN